MAVNIVRVLFVGEDQVSGPAKRIAFSLNRILAITAGIAITRAIFAVGNAFADVAKQAFNAAAEFQTLQIRYEGLIARQMTALNSGDAFSAMLGETTEMAGWQIDQFEKLREQYDMYLDEQMRLIDAGKDEGAYFDQVSNLVDTYAQKVAASIPGFEKMETWQQKAALGALGMSEALENAIGPANELIEWTKVMAVTTPFTAESLAKANTLGMAMGFTTEETKRLTLATGNFTAGMGLTEEVIERIVYNFGQMRQQGKVTGTELRDLARGAFVPVTDVLKRMQENLEMGGMEFDDFRKLAAKGKVPVEAFFEAFMEIAERDFPDAMERMSKTWQGVTSNIQDFISVVIGTETLGPLVDKLAERMDASLKRMMAPEVRMGFRELGVTVGEVFDEVMATIPDVSAAFQDLAETLGMSGDPIETLKGIVEGLGNAFVWVLERIEGATTLFNSVLTPAIEAFNKALEDTEDTLSPFLDPIKEFAQQHGDKFVDVLNRTVEIFAILVGFTAGLKVLGFIVRVILKGIGGPLLAISAVLAAVSLAWENNWFGIRDTLTEVWEGTLKPAFENIKEWFENELPVALQAFWDTFTGKASEAKEGLAAVFADVGTKLGEARDKFLEFKDKAIEPIKRAWEDLQVLFGEIGYWVDVVKERFEHFKTALDPIVELLGTVFAFVLDTVKQGFEAWFPVVQQFVEIVSNNLGTAFNLISTFIQEHVLPALAGLYGIIRDHIVPTFMAFSEAISEAIAVFVEFVSGVIENLVLPVLAKLTEFWNQHIAPAISAVLELVGAIAEKFGEFATAILENIVIPALTKLREWFEDKIKDALEKVKDFIEDKVNPALEKLAEWVDEKVVPALEWLKDHVLEPLLGVFDTLGGMVDKATGFFKDLAERISEIKLPKWLQPGSPTPFEIGLTGINEQLEDFRSLLGYVARDANRFPNMERKLGTLSGIGGVGAIGAGSSTNIGQIYISIDGAQDPRAVIEELMIALRQQGVFINAISR